jgi:hypothetical protein
MYIPIKDASNADILEFRLDWDSWQVYNSYILLALEEIWISYITYLNLAWKRSHGWWTIGRI